ncbi:DUF3592 domain-containing protein [Sphaerisporangium perillae]|uniref:DUF3592 domain-containing protein n=1 Tax=Sphaerisporangium perillae TaxID=2935860 RepID=UPI00200EB653|nr:DUF3592 domain-containing protein [Sphaerisporangium perillae]
MSSTAWIVLGFGLAALVFGGIGIGLLVSAREFRRIAQRVPGQVIRLRPSRGENGTTYFPTVRFTTVIGQQVEAETNYGTNPPVAPVGGPVTVLYDPAKPTRMRLDGFWAGGTVIAVVFAGVGAVFLVVTAAVALSGG